MYRQTPLYNKAADTRVADNMDVETRPTNSQKLYNGGQ